MVNVNESFEMSQTQGDNQRWQSVASNNAAADGDFFLCGQNDRRVLSAELHIPAAAA